MTSSSKWGGWQANLKLTASRLVKEAKNRETQNEKAC